VVRAAGAGGPTGGLDPRHDPADAPHRLGQQAGVGGVVNVGRHHGGVGADFSHPQQLALGGLGQQGLVERLDHLAPTSGGDLHEGGRVRHLPVDADAAEQSPRDRVGHLGTHRLVPQPVAKLQEHQPQVRLDRGRRPPEDRVEVWAERGEERLVVQQRVHPGQLGRQPE